MALWHDIAVEIDNGSIPENFTVAHLLTEPNDDGYLVNGIYYRESTLRTALANYCSNPPGFSVRQGQLARFHRVDRGLYRLLEHTQIEDRPTEHRASYLPGTPSPIQTNNATDPQRETKQSFLAECGGFVDWFTNSMNEFDGFQHEWRTRGHRNQCGFPLNTRWSCTSLYSAYQQYAWPATVESELDEFVFSGTTFDQTSSYLNALKDSLKAAMSTDDPDATSLVHEQCCNILRWGGVYHRTSVAPHIRGPQEINNLITHLSETSEHLNKLGSQGFTEADLTHTDSSKNVFRLDSGTTKIYSLLCNSLIIYDGRVASALGFLVLRWWGTLSDSQKGNLDNSIPDVLRFSYDNTRAAAAGTLWRKPNLAGCESLAPLRVGERRVKENIRATWLIEESLNRDQQKRAQASNFSEVNANPIRAVEAALFMIGYAVNNE